MHPVIKHLLARQHKKVPVSDSRSIALVLYGGMMIGMRGVGAMEALEELGLAQAFDNIYGVSVGFPIGSALLAGEIKNADSILFSEIDYSRFINLWRFRKIMDTEYFIEVLRSKIPELGTKVLASNTRLYGRVVNKTTGQKEYKEAHQVGQENFFNLLRATITVPLLNPSPVAIGGPTLYSDTNIVPYLWEHSQHVLSGPDTDILIIYNFHLQQRKKVTDAKRVFEICPSKDWNLHWLERNPEGLKVARNQMRNFVAEQFKN